MVQLLQQVVIRPHCMMQHTAISAYTQVGLESRDVRLTQCRATSVTALAWLKLCMACRACDYA
jgi:hypothetical protein